MSYVHFQKKFQKCQYARTTLFKTEGRGWGLLAAENMKVTFGNPVLIFGINLGIWHQVITWILFSFSPCFQHAYMHSHWAGWTIYYWVLWRSNILERSKTKVSSLWKSRWIISLWELLLFWKKKTYKLHLHLMQVLRMHLSFLWIALNPLMPPKREALLDSLTTHGEPLMH